MACDTGLAMPAPLRQAGIENTSSQALPQLEQTLTPALVLFHLEAVYSTTPESKVRMRCFVVLRKYVCITLYAAIDEASRSHQSTKFEIAANNDGVK